MKYKDLTNHGDNRFKPHTTIKNNEKGVGYKLFIKNHKKIIKKTHYEDCGVNWQAETDRGKYILQDSNASI